MTTDTPCSPLSADECIELRDLLFAHKLTVPDGMGGSTSSPMYRYLIVRPGDLFGHKAEGTVIVAASPPVWDRAGLASSNTSIRAQVWEHISESRFADRKLSVVFRDHLQLGWPYEWSLTAKDSIDNMPVLLLVENPDGAVRGALMRESHMDQTVVRLANEAAEPEEVEALIAQMRALPLDARYSSWFKESNLEGRSLEEVIAATPETDAGQKMVVIYRGNEWLHDHWNNPNKGHNFPLELRSIADFHGTRVSLAKKQTRPGLDEVLANQTVAGDYDVLHRAVQLICSPLNDPDRNHQAHGTFESNPAVKAMADWWNAAAPAEHREAAYCRFYTWDEENFTFYAMDPEEPAQDADVMAGAPSFALFRREGSPTVAAVFFRGRAHNVEDGGTWTFYANGEQAWDIGLEPKDVDEAYYCAIGLKYLADQIPLPQAA
ncbi:hypothetical protein ABIC83_002921 [Roseateles asaccharophilus]|uniref:hypothetical protein n=1 Tax=Roseateles asaccharophilus TaxID=582607 RepID=UPI003837BF19